MSTENERLPVKMDAEWKSEPRIEESEPFQLIAEPEYFVDQVEKSISRAAHRITP